MLKNIFLNIFKINCFRLKSLSTELVTLRNRLHVSGNGNGNTPQLIGCTNFPPSNLNILPGKNMVTIKLSTLLFILFCIFF